MHTITELSFKSRKPTSIRTGIPFNNSSSRKYVNINKYINNRETRSSQ
jgi:hypothetical protein